MLEIALIGSICIVLINLILKHNKDFNLEINFKLLSFDTKSLKLIITIKKNS